MSGRLHALAALTPGKEPPVPIGQEAGWAPESVWTWWSLEMERLDFKKINYLLRSKKSIRLKFQIGLHF
jgi:hypothetical protein